MRKQVMAYAAIAAITALAWFPWLRVLLIEGGVSAGRVFVRLRALGWVWFGWLGPIGLATLWISRRPLAHLFHGFFGPTHARDDRRKWRYGLRIRWRVRWLELEHWRRQPKLETLRRHWSRPLALLLAGMMAILLLRWQFGPETGGFFSHLSKLLTGDKSLEWRDAAQPLLVLIGLPIAFLLWWFRDIHVNETLENQRKDVNLKQFQDVQMRAAGALDEKLPERARETTQIAAIHQLRPFLRGEFGESFRRPAWELLRARLAASAEVTFTRTVAEWIDEWHAEGSSWAKLGVEQRTGKVPPFAPSRLGEELRDALAGRLAASRVNDAERAVIRDEWRTVFRSTLPLSATCFDRVDFPAGTLLASREMSRCTFIGAILPKARFDGSDLRWARFDGANLSNARFDGSDLQWASLCGAVVSKARFDGANLRLVRLSGADLTQAVFDGCDLRGTRFQGANLSEAYIEGVDFRGAQLDDAQLWQACLNRANLRRARMIGANLSRAKLNGANLRWAHLSEADLSEAELGSANLRGARLNGANLAGALLDGANLEGALLDYRAILHESWQAMSESEREAFRQTFRERGAVFREELTQEHTSVTGRLPH